MTTRPLAANANIESLKKQAKLLLRSLKSGDVSARVRVERYFSNIEDVGLQDIQLVIAREHGFSSWAKLKTHFDRIDLYESPRDQLVDRFLSLATVSYFARIPADPARFEAALRLLQDNPVIVDESIYVAAAIGDAAHLARWLNGQPRLLDRKGGPYDWPPLLYAAYARVPGRSSLPAARLLIERGADPNAFYLDDGQYRFTALTGAFGEGEAGKLRQPEHPDCIAFARMLLDAGADPNDSQALYNRMFEPDNSCLKLLLEYGLSARHRNNWLVREDGKFVENSQTVFDYQLAWALEKRMPERVRLLVEHGADVIRPVNGRTPFEWAQLGGDRDLALYLVRKGAVAARLKPEDQLYISIMNVELPIEDVAGMMRELTSPAQMQRVHPAMLHEAVAENSFEPVRRMLTLGFDVNAMTSRTPLHEAALHGHIEMAKLLIEHGADTKIRDPYHYAPPIGWAEYNGQPDMVNFLKYQPLDIFAAAAYGMLDQLTALLDADPSLMERTFGSFRPSGRADPDRDWLTPLAFAVLNGRIEAIHFLMKRGADPAIRDASGRSLRHVARETGNDALLSILDGHTPMT